MKKILLLAALMLPSALYAEGYTVDSRHTFPGFEVSHMGLSTQRGRFDKTTGKITLDRAAKKGSVDITIDATSINTGLGELEKHLRDEDFFNVEKYPEIKFKSDKMDFDGENPKAVHGELTMLGTTKPVTLAISSFNCRVHPINKKYACGADATATIKRSDFNMTYAIPGVSDKVKLVIQIEAFRDNQ